MPNYKVNPEQIDALLPQTQCRECGYDGCMPYARAIVNQDEALDRCLPGGVPVLKQLGALLEQEITGLEEDLAERTRKPATVVIDEATCIGCTKCIQVCPVDAIIGSAKQMHTILQGECTGCGLCIPACPVDCIDLKELAEPNYDIEHAKARFEARNKRLAKEQQLKKQKHQAALHKAKDSEDSRKQAKKAAIAAAVARAKAKRKA